MSDKKTPEDPMAEGSTYDHKTGVLNEPKKEDEPQTVRHQVDPVRDPALFDEEEVNAPIPRRGDPFAHQRDEKAAQAGFKAEAKKDETGDREADKRADERARRDNLSAAERARPITPDK